MDRLSSAAGTRCATRIARGGSGRVEPDPRAAALLAVQLLAAELRRRRYVVRLTTEPPNRAK